MRHITSRNHEFLFTDAGLAAVYEALDDLHSAASEGKHHKMTPLDNRELVGWLREVDYTVQEIIAEIEGLNTLSARQHSTLTIVK